MEVTQFRRAIADGTFSWIEAALGEALRTAYVEISRFNAALEAQLSGAVRGDSRA